MSWIDSLLVYLDSDWVDSILFHAAVILALSGSSLYYLKVYDIRYSETNTVILSDRK